MHPPRREKKKHFFEGLRILIKTYKNVILVGDFNTVFSKMDMADGMVFRTDMGRKELKEMMEERNLIDVWRENHERKREFSRRQLVGNFMCQTRIDFILSERDMEFFLGDICYKDTSLSDHKMLLWNIDFSKEKKGPGVWILNSEILTSESYRIGIEEILDKEKEDGMYFEDKRLWWQNVKYEIRKYSINHSKLVQKVKKAKELEIRKKLRKETNKSEVNIKQIILLEEELRKIEEEKCKGAMIRSKAKNTIAGEKCTKFFFNLEKSRGKAKLIKELKNKKGEIVKDISGILTEVKDYYEGLFETKGIDEKAKIQLLESVTAKVSREDKKECDKEISEEEIVQAINSLKGNKSPGTDGIVNEFYKVFKEKISGILKEVYKEIFDKRELDQRMSIGLMKLIYKRKGSKNNLSNFRPITMLNTDLKILSKILANRMKNILPKIIVTNQAYGVRGRDIADITSGVRDIISYLNETQKDGYVVNLDFEKAFDRVEHDFLFAILERFGFGKNFKEWIKILYNNVMTRVTCNGFLTEPFRITRSIRQGCPLSAQLYTLVAEPLGLMIKKNKSIQGIKIEEGKEEKKIFQYADDTTLILKDLESMKEVMRNVERYGKGTGARVNGEKTVYMKFGKVPNLGGVFNFEEVKETKILGVTLGKDEKGARERMFEKLLGEMERRLIFWRGRFLSLKGKILVVNALMLSKMWYILMVSAMPRWVEVRIKRCVLDFIWEKKPPRVAYNTLIGQADKGGMGLSDVELKKKSMRIKVVKKYIDDQEKGEWKDTMKYYLDKCGNVKLGDSVLWMKMKAWMFERIPDFYKEVLKAWGFFLSKVDFIPGGRKEILNQPLFFNKHIVKSGKEIFFKKWWEVGIARLRDIMYEIREGFLPVQVIIDELEEAKEEYDINNVKKQYKEMKSAIPKAWINEIQKEEKEEGKTEVYFVNQNKRIGFSLGNVKMFYQVLREEIFKKPNSNDMWLRNFNGLKEEEIWKNMRGVLVSTNLECLDYFIRHNVIWSEMRLCIIKKEQSALCKVCKKQDEGLLHLFLLCEELGSFFKVLKEIVNDLGERKEDQDWQKTFMFGKEEKCKNKIMINLLIILAKNAIWKRRNIVKNRSVRIDVWTLYKHMVEDYMFTLCKYWRLEGKAEMFMKMFSSQVQNILLKHDINVSVGKKV